METEAKQAKRAAAADAEEGFKVIPIGGVLESPTNPRKYFDKDALKELADSIREKGILQPLLVRFMPRESVSGASISEHHEIVAGARRYRAAKLAGLKELPCLVRQLTDEQALEAQVIENLQRADVSPLEEARGYQELMKLGRTPEDLAKQVGKSERYIYARIELTRLSEPVLKSLDEGKITPSHAQLIATLDGQERQQQALERCFLEGFDDASAGELVQPDHNDDLKGLVGIRDFQKTITAMKVGTSLANTLASLKSGGFKAFLVCNGWTAGRQVLSQGRWKTQGKKPCKFPAKGVLVEGPKRGEVIDICATTNCSQHFKNHPVSSPAPKVETRAAKLTEIKGKLESEARHAIAGSIYREFITKSPATLDREDLARVAGMISWSIDDKEVLAPIFPFVNTYGDSREKKAAELDSKELAQFIRAVAWQEAASWGPYRQSTAATKRYLERAQKFGIDVKGITKKGLDEMEARFQAEKDRIDATEVQTSAEPDDEESSEVGQIKKAKPSKKRSSKKAKKAKTTKKPKKKK